MKTFDALRIAYYLLHARISIWINENSARFPSEVQIKRLNIAEYFFHYASERIGVEREVLAARVTAKEREWEEEEEEEGER